MAAQGGWDNPCNIDVNRVTELFALKPGLSTCFLRFQEHSNIFLFLRIMATPWEGEGQTTAPYGDTWVAREPWTDAHKHASGTIASRCVHPHRKGHTVTQSHDGISHSNEKNTRLIHVTTRMDLEYVRSSKANPLRHSAHLSESTDVKFKTRQRYPTVTEVTRVTTSGRRGAGWEEAEGDPCGSRKYPLPELGGSYAGTDIKLHA